MIRHLLVCLLLGFVTLELLGAMKYLAASEAVDSISDFLAYPGALLSSPFFPEGIHSSVGGAYWPLAVWVCNVLFYAALWLCVLALLRKLRSRRQLPPTNQA